MTEIKIDSDVLNQLADGVYLRGHEFALTPEGFDSEKGFKDTDRLTYYAFEDDLNVAGGWNIDRILVVRRLEDGVIFGVSYSVPSAFSGEGHVDPFTGDQASLTEMVETKTIVIERKYSFGYDGEIVFKKTERVSE